eukprot:25720_1
MKKEVKIPNVAKVGQYNCIQTMRSMKPSGSFSSFSMTDLGDMPMGYSKLVYALNEPDALGASLLNSETESIRKFTKCVCKPKCCNSSCCALICFSLLILITILSLVIYSFVRQIHTPQFKAIYVELFSYDGFTEQLVPMIYVNGTGQIIAEMQNNMNMNGFLHHVEFEVMAMNIVGNKEQIGSAKCCERELEFNMSNPFNSSVQYKFDEDVFIPAKRRVNISMLFAMPALSEEIWDLMITTQMIPQHGFAVDMMMNGYGHIKSTKWGFDMQIFADCALRVNTSQFVLSQKTNDVLLKNVWPPRLYYYQTFTIIDSNCTFSITSLKYIWE